jgi:hypothetical protein
MIRCQLCKRAISPNDDVAFIGREGETQPIHAACGAVLAMASLTDTLPNPN